MFNTACPGLFGTPAEFRRNFEHPIVASRDADATDKQLEKVRGWQRQREREPAGWRVGQGRRERQGSSRR